MHAARPIATAGLIALCCALTAGCSAKDTANDTGAPRLETVDVHFYRHADEPSVYRVSKTMYCLVKDEAQMAAFGGFDQVRVVAPNVDFKRGKKPVHLVYCPPT